MVVVYSFLLTNQKALSWQVFLNRSLPFLPCDGRQCKRDVSAYLFNSI